MIPDTPVITHPPRNYGEWLSCLDAMGAGKLSAEGIALLRQGTCSACGDSAPYLQRRLVDTVNAVLQRRINDFTQDARAILAEGEFDELYRRFRRLAREVENDLFFSDLAFLDGEFRRELRASVVSEVCRFRDSFTGALYRQCTEISNSALEDALYMIKRIALFETREFCFE